MTYSATYLVRLVAIQLLCTVFSQCQMPPDRLQIISSKTLTDVPSASGLVRLAVGFMVVGDDSPYLFLLDDTAQISRRTAIFPESYTQEDGRIPKDIKPDFEAMELIEERELLIIGSGSKVPSRNLLIRLDWPSLSGLATYDLSNFYAHLLALPEMKGYELNIEGLAYHQQQLYLLNRSNNLIFRFDYAEFMASLQVGKKIPDISVFSVPLPYLDGYPAQLTGATIGGEVPQLFFTAAVEATDNAYDDGEILGSFFGQVPLVSLHEAAAYRFYPITFGEEALKVESIALAKDPNPTHFYFVTDSDGGASLLLEGSLK